MTKKVLSVGQCGPDHGAICQLIEGNFDAKVVPAALPKDAMKKLESDNFDLVLVNRKLDADYSDGLEVIKSIKADSAYSTLPVMLVTNYEDHQQQAVSVGAVRGFGKLEYSKPETHQRLAEYLG